MTPQVRIQAIFFLQAVAGGGIFARIPDVQTALGLSESLLGYALAAGMAGSLGINLISGRIAGLIGTKVILLWGVPFLAVINAVIASSTGIAFLFLVLIISGATFALTNVAMNVEADRIEGWTSDRIMNRCHGLWSFGMLLAAAIGVAARAYPISPGVHLWSVAPLVVLLSLWATWPMEAAPVGDRDKTEARGIALPSSRTFLVVLFGVSAGVGQMAAQNWSVIYMRDTFTVPDWLDTAVLPLYLLAMAVGRIMADGWIKAAGAPGIAFLLTSIALMGSVLIAASPVVSIVLVGFVLLGVGSAVHFPLMITAASRMATRSAAEAVSAALFLTGLAMAVTPGIMGLIAEHWGLRAGFAALVIPFVVSLVLVRRVVK